MSGSKFKTMSRLKSLYTLQRKKSRDLGYQLLYGRYKQHFGKGNWAQYYRRHKESRTNARGNRGE